MKYYEIYKPNARVNRGGKFVYDYELAIKEGYFVVWNDEKIKKSFNNGNGTRKDFEQYMFNNRKYCHYIKIKE